ncbi:hypothetical protein BH11MYX3_BH11MYX3_30980 [soil metagenome]
MRVVAVSPIETKTLRDVNVPSYVVDLQWVLADPIVLLGRPNPDSTPRGGARLRI